MTAPDAARAVMQLGYIAADAGRLQEARELQERALALWTGVHSQQYLVRRRSCSSWPASTRRSESHERARQSAAARRWRSASTSGDDAVVALLRADADGLGRRCANAR